jgi:RNA polymerase sigma-70 factor (sigma-E family)
MPEALPATFDDCYPSLFARAYRVGFRLLGERGDAEEVAQEALTRALVRWRRVADYAEPWVVRVATNLAIDMLRRRARMSTEEVELVMEADAYAEERLDLVRALAALPRRQREVVTLRYIGDLSEADIARVLDCSNGTVKSHASRGLAALRQHFNPVVDRG